MQGFKNLMRSNHFTEDALQYFIKKIQEIRKTTISPLEHFQSLVAASQSSTTLLEQWLINYQNCQVEELHKSMFWSSLGEICKKLCKSQQHLSTKLRGYFMEASRQIKNKPALEFQSCIELVSKVRAYRSQEQALLQNYKIFCKLHKNMISYIQAYKKTFTDVKIIYNRQEKIKRYSLCQKTYNQMMVQYNQITEKLTMMSDSKKGIIQSYNRSVQIIGKTIKSVGQKMQVFSNQYLNLVYQQKLGSINIFRNALQQLEKHQLQIQFAYRFTDSQAEEYLQPGITRQKHKFFPKIILNYQYLKDSHILQLGGLLSSYEKQIGSLIRKRKTISRQLLQYVGYFVKGYEKIANLNKEFVSGFQKKKKKFVEFYEIQDDFLKVFSYILDLSEINQEKIVKQFISRYKTIQNLLSEESKCLQAFQKDYRSFCVQKFSNKRQLKKKSSLNRSSTQITTDYTKNEIQLIKIQTFEKMGDLKQIFQTRYDKLKKITKDIKQQVESLLFILQKSTIQIYTVINSEVRQQTNQNTSTKIFIFDQTNLPRLKIFEQTLFAELLNEQVSKISFDGELHKVEQFKKLKKPQDFFQEKVKKFSISDRQSQQSRQDTVKQSQSCQFVGEKRLSRNKYQSFLISRGVMTSNQRYMDSYACGLAYNIILAGRLHITNEKLYFYSKFNPNNIFFGETFIQIPKKDIIKVEKRQNAVVFDNSISITTVNGEMFFTSFILRNEAYKMILSSLDLAFDEMMYEPQQISPVAEQEAIDEDDDIKEESLSQRANKIDSMLKKLEYKELISTTLKYKDMTALKYFKMFELNNQISYNRRKFSGFQEYFREVVGQTQINYQEWKPNILDYLNSSNIKSNMPLAFKRVIRQVVPVANTGIPFMPKTSKIQETMTVYFYSRHKIVFQIEYKSFGVPYCDYFLLNFKKEIITTEPDTVSFKMFFTATFLTFTIMKGIIQSRGFEESRNTVTILVDQMHKYLKYLERQTITKAVKASVATTKNESGNQQSIIDDQPTYQLRMQLSDVQKQNQDLKAHLNSQKKIQSRRQKIFLFSIVLNIVLILILMI